MDPFEKLNASMKGDIPQLPLRLEGAVDHSFEKYGQQEHPPVAEVVQSEPIVPDMLHRRALSRKVGTVATNNDSSVDWRHRAACLEEDPELFFPIGNTGPALLQVEEAKAVCRGCMVAEVCLKWAMDTGQHYGVWGGKSEDERRRLQRRRSHKIRIRDPES